MKETEEQRTRRVLLETIDRHWQELRLLSPEEVQGLVEPMPLDQLLWLLESLRLGEVPGVGTR